MGMFENVIKLLRLVIGRNRSNNSFLGQSSYGERNYESQQFHNVAEVCGERFILLKQTSIRSLVLAKRLPLYVEYLIFSILSLFYHLQNRLCALSRVKK
jgi:hypothetical protein